MAKVEVEIDDNSDEINQNMDAAIERGLIAVGMTAETYAKEYCTAVDTGRLRGSITHSVVSEEKSVYIGTNVEYAPYIEYGHHSYAGLHFIKKAASNHSAEYKKLIEDSMKNA